MLVDVRAGFGGSGGWSGRGLDAGAAIGTSVQRPHPDQWRTGRRGRPGGAGGSGRRHRRRAASRAAGRAVSPVRRANLGTVVDQPGRLRDQPAAGSRRALRRSRIQRGRFGARTTIPGHRDCGRCALAGLPYAGTARPACCAPSAAPNARRHQSPRCRTPAPVHSHRETVLWPVRGLSPVCLFRDAGGRLGGSDRVWPCRVVSWVRAAQSARRVRSAGPAAGWRACTSPTKCLIESGSGVAPSGPDQVSTRDFPGFEVRRGTDRLGLPH